MVETAHQAGYLPVATARDELAGLAEAVTPEALAVARRLRSIDPPNRTIWNLVPNPLPTVRSLASYVDRAEEIIHALEDQVSKDDSIPDELAGPGQLGIQLRSLADALDDAASKGVA